MAELTAQGLLIRRYPEIYEAIKTAMARNIPIAIDWDEDLLHTQIVQIIANEIAIAEEMLQVLNDARDRDKAEGNALDDVLGGIGLRRIAPSKSAGNVFFTTRNQVTIPTDTILSNPSNSIRFRTTEIRSANPRDCFAVWYSIEVEEERTYTINIEGNDFSFTSEVGDELNDIIAGLVSVINFVGSDKFEAASDSPAGTPLLYIKSIYDGNIDTSVLQYMTAERVKFSSPVEAVEYGAIQAPAGSVNKLVTGVGGVFSVVNAEAFGVGRNRETDTEYRTRAQRTLSISGSATYAALYTALSNLSGVSEVVIIENATGSEVGGVPAHAFEAIINIPDTVENDQLIANTLWNEKPIGIESHGDTEVTIFDAQGDPRILKFSRPVNKYIAIRVTYTLYDEEPTPDLLSDLIKEAVMTYGGTLSSGVDVIPRRFIGPIYANTGGGLGTVTVEAQALDSIDGTPDSGEWSEDIISIIPRETAAFQLSKIYLVGPP